MSKFPKRAFTGALATAAAVVTLGAPAFAAHTVTPSTNLTNNQSVSVSFSGLPAFATATIMQCNNDQGLAFSVLDDCAFNAFLPANADASGAGSESYIVEKEPNGYADGDVNWKCDTTGDATGSVVVTGPTGGPVRVFSTCRIRVVSGVATGADNESFQNISFATAPDPVVPEAPFAALLPVGAVAVLAGGYLIVRGRKPALNV